MKLNLSSTRAINCPKLNYNLVLLMYKFENNLVPCPLSCAPVFVRRNVIALMAKPKNKTLKNNDYSSVLCELLLPLSLSERERVSVVLWFLLGYPVTQIAPNRRFFPLTSCVPSQFPAKLGKNDNFLLIFLFSKKIKQRHLDIMLARIVKFLARKPNHYQNSRVP